MNGRAFLAVLLLAACDQPAQPPAANQTVNDAKSSLADPAAAPVPSLDGEWTITEINGRAPGQVWPMIARITADSFTIQSECRRFAWGFRQDRNIVQLTENRAAGADCPRVRSPDEESIEKPVALANIAMFSDDGRQVELSGPGGRVIMTRR